MSFFDESDEPTRVRVAPAPPGRAARRRAVRDRRRPARRPDHQTARIRQLVALGVALLAADRARPRRQGLPRQPPGARAEGLQPRRRRDRHATPTSEVSKPFFDLLGSGDRQRRTTCRSRSTSCALAADEDATPRARLDVPGDMKAAQQHLLCARPPRARALDARSPTELRRPLRAAASGRKRRRRRSPGRCRRSWPPTSLYSQRVAPLIKQALDDAGIRGQTHRRRASSCRQHLAVPRDRRRSASARRAGGTQPAAAAPGPRTATASIERHRRRQRRCSPRRRQPRPAPRPPSTFTVNFQNQGDNDENDVRVTVAVTAPAGRPITAQQDASTDDAPGKRREVDIPLDEDAARRHAATLTVDVGGGARARRTTDNNTPDLHGPLHAG